MPASKISQYIAERVSGLAPLSAAMSAGYAQSGISVVTARLEAREDVRQALRAAKRKGGVGKALRPLTAPDSKRQYRSVADEPDDNDLDKKLDPWKLKDKYSNPLDLLLDVMNNKAAPGGLRIQCAKDAMPYCHARKETSKKEDAQERAKKTGAKSMFGAMPTPIRKVVG